MKINCPYCNKELIDLSINMVNKGVYEFWCDDCDVEIYVTKPNIQIANDSIITTTNNEVVDICKTFTLDEIFECFDSYLNQLETCFDDDSYEDWELLEVRERINKFIIAKEICEEYLY